MAELLAREFGFEQQHFERARQLLTGLAGLRLHENKVELVYNRLSRRLRELRLDSFVNYFEVVENDPDEQVRFVNALTTNLTSFFREAHHLDALAELASTWRAAATLRVWSAACSTGEEPYSIGMTLANAASKRRFDYSILATDIDTEVLSTARNGVYELDRVKSIPAPLRSRFMQRGTGTKAGLVRIVPELASKVQFAQINLLHDRWPDLGEFDVVFCRNVLIYFSREAQRKVIAKMHALLPPGGLLCTGHAESLSYASELFSIAGRTMYRKPS